MLILTTINLFLFYIKILVFVIWRGYNNGNLIIKTEEVPKCFTADYLTFLHGDSEVRLMSWNKTLTLSADIAPVENANEDDILVEYETGKYYRQFTISELINQEKIDAKLNDGVLRLKLPKVEKATPKKIVVKTA